MCIYKLYKYKNCCVYSGQVLTLSARVSGFDSHDYSTNCDVDPAERQKYENYDC